MALSDFRSVHLPYCLDRMKDGRYVVLNREYKPLGFGKFEHVIYDKYPIAHKFKRLTARVAARLSARGREDLERIYLYNDACIPTDSVKTMQNYLKRLAILAKLRIDKTAS